MATKLRLSEAELAERAKKAALSAIEHGQYNMMIPIKDALFVWLKTPSSSKVIHMSTSSKQFDDAMLELKEQGLEWRVLAELNGFTNIDSAWVAIRDRVQKSFEKV